MQLVLLAQDNLSRIELGIAFERCPLDSDGEIVPHEAALIIGIVDIITFVAKIGSIRQNKKAECEPTGNKTGACSR